MSGGEVVEIFQMKITCGGRSRFARLAVLVGAILSMVGCLAEAPVSLWYRQPAERWLEALPIGNGRLGAMVFGGVAEERLALNESTFWSGGPSDQHDPPGGREAFQEIRRRFAVGDYPGSRLWIGKMLGRELNYGTSLPAGDLLIRQSGTDGEILEYRRELDLDAGMASVSFVAHGVHYRRQVLASHPEGVIAVRFTADRPGSVSLRVAYRGGKFPWQVESVGRGSLKIQGQAWEKKHSDGHTGVTLAGRIQVSPEGGSLRSESGAVEVEGANSVTVWVALRTDFRGANPSRLSELEVDAAARKGWQRVQSTHLGDHRQLFRRVKLDLAGGAVSTEPTDARLQAMARGGSDPGLEALYFQYGRYLTVAGSRKDSPLPLHLQGIWNDGLAAEMGWTCDYHLDINTEQNYWPVEVAHLSECGDPLFRLIDSLRAPGRRTARTVYGIERGWVCHVFTNPWGFTAPGWSQGWGLHVTGGAWIATHLWEHYLFTGDAEFLERRAYPVLKEAAEFFAEYLYPDPSTGFLMTGPSVSPERGGEAGPGGVHDRAVVYELFTACIEASRALRRDDAFRERLETLRAGLPPYRVGRNGQLQEWFHSDDGGETNHRHTSHLVGLMPFAQITPRGTPELATAAAKSLQLRLQRPDWEDVEWSAGNSVCYFARLGRGDLAHAHLRNLILSDSDLNLMSFSRGGIAGASQNIFAIDGNTSGTLGIAEMLVQSHAGEIELLPALPASWSSGTVRGLCARGGFVVDVAWNQGRVTEYRITSARPKPVRLRVGGEVRTVMSQFAR